MVCPKFVVEGWSCRSVGLINAYTFVIYEVEITVSSQRLRFILFTLALYLLVDFLTFLLQRAPVDHVTAGGPVTAAALRCPVITSLFCSTVRRQPPAVIRSNMTAWRSYCRSLTRPNASYVSPLFFPCCTAVWAGKT